MRIIKKLIAMIISFFTTLQIYMVTKLSKGADMFEPLYGVSTTQIEETSKSRLIYIIPITLLIGVLAYLLKGKKNIVKFILKLILFLIVLICIYVVTVIFLLKIVNDL